MNVLMDTLMNILRIRLSDKPIKNFSFLTF